jgi:hypothetical protein
MMAALSFIPKNDVENSWNEQLDSEFYSQNEEMLTPLTNYSEDTWIVRLDRRNRRRPAIYFLYRYRIVLSIFLKILPGPTILLKDGIMA